MDKITIEARWEDGVWKVDVDPTLDHSGFVCRDNLHEALTVAVIVATMNYKYRRQQGEKLEGKVDKIT